MYFVANIFYILAYEDVYKIFENIVMKLCMDFNSFPLKFILKFCFHGLFDVIQNMQMFVAFILLVKYMTYVTMY